VSDARVVLPGIRRRARTYGAVTAGRPKQFSKNCRCRLSAAAQSNILQTVVSSFHANMHAGVH
jgi:hypothetical protein